MLLSIEARVKFQNFMKRIILSASCFLLSLVAVGQGKPIPRDAAYYKTKGLQVFPEYRFAVKCDCLLEDTSDQVSGNNDLAYSCLQNTSSKSTVIMTQIIVKRVPGGYANASASKKAEIEASMLRMLGGKKVAFLGQNAVVTDYDNRGITGRAISFIRNGATYTFNMSTNDNLEGHFNSLTNNIIFF